MLEIHSLGESCMTTPAAFRLAGRVALVTGGNGGVGRASLSKYGD
jgi:hypothetical protein